MTRTLEGPRRSRPEARTRTGPARARTDLWIALGLGAAAAIAYGITARPDWSFDPLRYAEQMQGGFLDRLLVGPQHVLGNLIPLGLYQGLRALGYGGGAWPVMAVVSVAAAAATVALVFVAARAFGATRGAAATVAVTLAVTPGLWRAGASGGVYGVTVLTIVLAWIAAHRYLDAPGDGRAAVLGATTGAAVAAHLASLVFVPAAVVVLLAGRRPGAKGPPTRRLHAAAGAAVAVVGVAMAVASGIATGFSLPEMARWLLNPEIGGPAKRPAAVDWGIAGLFEGAILPGKTGRFSLQVLVVLAVVGAGAARAATALRPPGRPRAVAAAMLLHVGLAFLAASWFQALRADYYMPGLVSLAVAAAAGRPVLGEALRRRVGAQGARRAALVAAVILVAAFAAWNVGRDVVGRLRISDQRHSAAAVIAQRIPSDAYVLLYSELAGVMALDGHHADGGWAALARQVEAGAARPGLLDALRAAGDRPIYVSSYAFDLESWQEEYLGVTRGDLWIRLWTCCDPQEVARFEANLGPEGLYRLGRVPPGEPGAASLDDPVPASAGSDVALGVGRNPPVAGGRALRAPSA